MNEQLSFFVQPAPWACGCEVYIKCGDGTWIQNIERCHEAVSVPMGTIPPPAMQLMDAQAQDLMDKLWAAGYRPTEGSGSAGSLAATERHLEDMRQLVFESLHLGSSN